MAKATLKKDIIVLLELDEAEAIWLQGLVQNPIGIDRDSEPLFESNMRKNLFEAIKSALQE